MSVIASGLARLLDGLGKPFGTFEAEVSSREAGEGPP